MKIFLSLVLTASLLGFNEKPATKTTLKALNLAGPSPIGVYYPNTTVAVSTNGNYTLVYQGDGNLVLYNRNHVGLWCSGPIVSNPYYVDFDGNANIYVKSSNGTITDWEAHAALTQQPFPNFFWVLQDDGNFVRYWGTPGNILTTGSPSISTNTENGQRSPHYNTIQ